MPRCARTWRTTTRGYEEGSTRQSHPDVALVGAPWLVRNGLHETTIFKEGLYDLPDHVSAGADTEMPLDFRPSARLRAVFEGTLERADTVGLAIGMFTSLTTSG